MTSRNRQKRARPSSVAVSGEAGGAPTRRPRLKRSHTILIRVSDTEYRVLAAAAESRGLTVNRFLRTLALNHPMPILDAGLREQLAAVLAKFHERAGEAMGSGQGRAACSELVAAAGDLRQATEPLLHGVKWVSSMGAERA